MLIDIEANHLYTDEGKFIKTLHCPKSVEWNQLIPIEGKLDRMCAVCSNRVIDTDSLKDEDLLQIIEKEPHTCFAVGLNQSNVKIL